MDFLRKMCICSSILILRTLTILSMCESFNVLFYGLKHSP
jgi:hypothetical protein